MSSTRSRFRTGSCRRARVWWSKAATAPSCRLDDRHVTFPGIATDFALTPQHEDIRKAERDSALCEQAVMTHGGFGYAKDFHVERYLREIMIPRIAPVSRELILSYIAEKVLGLPRSY